LGAGRSSNADVLALDGALGELPCIDPRQAQVVEMKFFGGLSAPEIAKVLGISPATVKRDRATPRLWLRREMRRAAAP
jgi:RNA polymerase sigma factor (sigma-70 family)